MAIMVTARLRRWRRNPLLAAHQLATVALGMAAVTAVISLMLAIAFQPLPFRDASQLVLVWNRVESGAPAQALSGSELIEFREGTGDLFSSLGGFLEIRLSLLDERGGSAEVRVARLEPAAFRALDIAPVLGRPAGGSISSPDGLGPVWISDNLWRSRYGASTSVIGETIRLASNAAGLHEMRAEIAGVLPSGRVPQPWTDAPVDVWAILPDDMTARLAKSSVFFALGQLAPERTVAEARAALTALADRRTAALDRRKRPVVEGFAEIALGPARRTIGLMAVGVALVLLLAFANLASLTVAEGSRRRLELSIRTSLGASRWRLWREIVAEHLALTAGALSLGVPLAWITLRGLARLVASADLCPPLPQPPALDVYVLFGFAISALVATSAWATLIVRGAGSGSSLRLGALSVQACLGIALMVLAVSLARGYARLTAVNLGPAPDRTLSLSVRPPYAGAPTAAQAADFNAQLLSLVRTMPDVETAGFVDGFPPFPSPVSFWKAGDLPESPRASNSPSTVSDDYFRTLGIPILFGRGFDGTDRLAGKPVAIIDLELARRNWVAPEEAVHAQISIGTRGTFEVVGVAGPFGGYWAYAPLPTIYLPQSQHPSNGGAVILRTRAATPNIGEMVRQRLRGMPVPAEISSAATLQAGWQATATRPRARMAGMLLLAFIGLVLGAQGVYALAASTVAARRQELAIRTALGASAPALVWLVLRQLVIAVVTGAATGVLGLIAVQRLAPEWISTALDEPAAPIALAVAVLLATAALGGFVPARSATRATSFAWLSR